MNLPKLLFAAMISLSAAYAQAAPSRMRPIEVIAPDGTPKLVVAVGYEHRHYYREFSGDGAVAWLPSADCSKSTPAIKTRARLPQYVSSFPTHGKLPFLVVLVEFADCGFSFDNLELPDGWTTGNTSWSSVSGYYGVSAPSIRLTDESSYVQTAVAGSDLAGLTFVMRASSLSEGSRLVVKGLDVSGRVNFTADIVPTPSRETYSVALPPVDVRSVRLEFVRVGKTVLSVDDITLTVGGYSP